MPELQRRERITAVKVRLTYPNVRPSVPELYDGTPASEWVSAKDLGATDFAGRDLYRLTSHAIYTPLAPGDIVLVEGEDVVGIEQLASLYTYDVDFALPANIVLGEPMDAASADKVEAIAAAWQRAAWVTQHTGLSFYVSAQDQGWLEREVMLCEFVDDMQLVRYPGMEIDFATAVANASLGDLTIGPWA